jgi:hypothetical protein
MSDIDLSILLSSELDVNGYEVSRSGKSINDHPNRVKLAGRTKLQCEVTFDIHDSTKWMMDKCLKSLAKLQG